MSYPREELPGIFLKLEIFPWDNQCKFFCSWNPLGREQRLWNTLANHLFTFITKGIGMVQLSCEWEREIYPCPNYKWLIRGHRMCWLPGSSSAQKRTYNVFRCLQLSQAIIHQTLNSNQILLFSHYCPFSVPGPNPRLHLFCFVNLT